MASLTTIIYSLVIISSTLAGPIKKAPSAPIAIGPFSRFVNFDCPEVLSVSHYRTSSHHKFNTEAECMKKCGGSNSKEFKTFTYVQTDGDCNCQRGSTSITLNATIGSICTLAGSCEEFAHRESFIGIPCQSVEWSNDNCSVIDKAHFHEACFPLACEPGYSGVSGICTECTPGTSSPGGSHNPCTRCAFGTFTAKAGQEVCEICPSGLSSIGGRSCITTCPIGTGVEDNACILCQPGTWGAGGQTHCMPCKQGLESCDRYTGDPIVASLNSEIVQRILSSGLPVLEEELEELCAAVRPKLPMLVHGFSGSSQKFLGVTPKKTKNVSPKGIPRPSIKLNASKLLAKK